MVKPDVLESVSDRLFQAALQSSASEVVRLFEKITGGVDRPSMAGQADEVKADALVRFIQEDAELQHYRRQPDRSTRQLVRLAGKKYHGRYDSSTVPWSEVFTETTVQTVIADLAK
jgi:hypothetical protein